MAFEAARQEIYPYKEERIIVEGLCKYACMLGGGLGGLPTMVLYANARLEYRIGSSHGTPDPPGRGPHQPGGGASHAAGTEPAEGWPGRGGRPRRRRGAGRAGGPAGQHMARGLPARGLEWSAPADVGAKVLERRVWGLHRLHPKKKNAYEL
ncbi:unnamed protein product [Prorocentrum cordatum]|uniref:Uncharacterized protein n=1 Tax=Prorocentrum cordatum TaxID=2364126 RepID=A0ABN9WC17_9DINO|nr:unnamed protein product [Polarella glacialis]